MPTPVPARPVRSIGLISDTHGLLRPEALDSLRGSDLIMHAGDIGGKGGKGGPEVLAALRALAPLIAIRGNNDHGAWAKGLRERETVEIAGSKVHLIHDIGDLDFDPGTMGIRCILSGHSHRPLILERDNVLFINPGSAGPRRFSLPVSVGRVRIVHGKWIPEIMPIVLKKTTPR
ncbi:MAG: putative phosphoesterase2C [Fibrobacteres bacterium]|nr:putative phosphoesterase2C [Fibrobacterota bacterium]